MMSPLKGNSKVLTEALLFLYCGHVSRRSVRWWQANGFVLSLADGYPARLQKQPLYYSPSLSNRMCPAVAPYPLGECLGCRLICPLTDSISQSACLSAYIMFSYKSAEYQSISVCVCLHLCVCLQCMLVRLCLSLSIHLSFLIYCIWWMPFSISLSFSLSQFLSFSLPLSLSMCLCFFLGPSVHVCSSQSMYIPMKFFSAIVEDLSNGFHNDTVSVETGIFLLEKSNNYEILSIAD